MRIEFPKWLPQDDIKKLATILAKEGDSRLVGGCVRDILVGNQTEDFDIATQVESHTALKLLSDEGIKCIPTGIKHGTITAILNGNTFQITTLRKDIETFGRHATVEFTNDWHEDAKRRDFTMNAMYLDVSGQLYDFFDGYKDLQNKIIKFVGDPTSRIHEDYLRILRYFRFYSYFGSPNLDDASFTACSKLSENIKKLSGERISQEIWKVLTARFINKALLLMNDCKVWQQIFDFALPHQVEKLTFSDSALVNFAVIIQLANVDKDHLIKIAKKLRFSRKEISILTLLCYTIKLPPTEVEKIIYYYGKLHSQMYLSMLRVMGTKISIDAIKKTTEWHVPKLPITGYDLQAIGFTGKDIGKVLRFLEGKWVDSNFSLTKSELLDELKQEEIKRNRNS